MKIRHILIRDLRILLSDKKTLAVILLMPIILTTILSVSLAGVFSEEPEVPSFEIVVVKEYDYVDPQKALSTILDNNPLGALMPADTKKDLIEGADADLEDVFLNEFLGHEEISKIMTYSVNTSEEAYKQLNKDEISAIVILPENFLTAGYANMYTTYQSEMIVQVVRNPERSLTSGIASSIIEAFMDRMSATNIRKNAAIETLLAADVTLGSESKLNEKDFIKNIIESSMTQNLEINYMEETASGKAVVDSRSYYSAGMLTLFLLFSAGRGSYMLLQEKRDFTYQRMLTAGLSKWQILSGKFFVIYSIALIQLTALILFSTFVLGVKWGQPLDLILVSAFTAFAVAGLGSLLAVITFVSEKTRIAGLFESVIFQVMGLLGGAYIPIEVLPDEVQILSRIPLNGVALKAYLELMSGAGLSEVREQLLLLILNGVLFAGGAIYLMGQKRGAKHVGSDQTQVTGA